MKHRFSPRAAARRLLAASLLLSCAVAQGGAQDSYPAPPALLQQFQVAAATVQHLVAEHQTDGTAVVAVDLGAERVHLRLSPHDVRSPDFQLVERSDQGLRVLPRPASVTWRGYVEEDLGSIVAATMVGGSMQGIVRASNGDDWALQPVNEVQPKAGPAVHVVYRVSDNQNLPWVCGVQGNLSAPVPFAAATEVLRICQIACEADVQYYQANGSNLTTTQNDITGVINAMDAIYQTDCQLTFTITQILVNTSTATNPYSSSVAGTLLGQFQSNWISNHANITRDVAHLFTGRNMGQASGGAIGIAYLSGICSTNTGYGVSQSRWTTNFTRRVAVTAHEVGHNFSAQHCDAVPPCYIMCSGVGGCQNVQTTFSQNERNQIIGFSNALPCLDVQPIQPQITSLSPASVRSFQPGTVTLTGQGFAGTTAVQVGAITLTNGFSTPDDATLRFNPPDGLPIGNVLVQTTNPAGTSNTANLQVNDSVPAGIRVNGAVVGGTNLAWAFGGTRNMLWVLAISAVNTTSPLLGLDVVDSPTVLAYGLTDPVNGLGSYSTFVPANTFSGLRIYSQIVELDLNNGLAGHSNSVVAATLIFQ